MKNTNQIKRAADAQSALYVWDCVTAILESGATPDRLDASHARDVARVLKIAAAAKLRAYAAYERAAAQAAAKGAA